MGSFFVYLAQPLTITNNIASFINVNVFVRAGRDFNFYGYNALSSIYPPTALAPPASTRDALTELDEQDDFEVQSTITPFNVISEPVETNKDLSDEFRPVIQNMYKPIISVRDILRRFQKALSGTIESNVGGSSSGVYIPLVNIIGMPNAISYRNNIYSLCSLFHGFKGSLKFKISLSPVTATGTLVYPGNLPIYVAYLPPTHITNSSSTSLNTFGNTPGSLSGTPTTVYLEQLREGSGVGGLSGYTFETTHPSPLVVASSLNGFVEFEVDIQTIFRYSILTKTFDSAQDYATALGALYIYTDTTVPVSSATTFRYSLQCGFGDDARLGFQVYNPNFQMCNKLADPGIGGVPTFLPLDFNQAINTSIRDAWYFTKTT
jgi:hypothetical protein